MMRSHGIAPNAASIKPAPGSSSLSSGPTSAPRSKSGANKKRKFSGEEENMDDDEESTKQGINKSRLKREVKGETGVHANLKEEEYREDSPSAQLQEGLKMGLCDVNRELVDYYSGGSSVGGGSVNGDEGGLEYGDVEGYAGAGMTAGVMTAGGMAAGTMGSYSQQPAGYSFHAGGYSGAMGSQAMMGNRNGIGSRKMMNPRGHAAETGGMGIGTQQYQSMEQGYDTQGGSESPLLVE